MSVMYSHPDYARPPIVEAVIELRFRKAQSYEEIADNKGLWQKEYRGFESQDSVALHYDAQKDEPSRTRRPVSLKFQSADMTDLLIVGEENFLCARLAPYCGWDSFFGRFQRDYQKFRQKLGPVPVSRIACRFINRLDIPGDEDDRVSPAVWTLLGPNLPLPWVSDVTQYAMRVVRKVPEFDASVGIATGTTGSPVPGCLSILLDIDAYQDDLNVRREDEILERLVRLRELKNRTFEDCLTDKARELFNET